MKTLTTLTAIAALLAGITVASAQDRAPDNNRANATQYNSQAADPANNTRSSGVAPSAGSQQQAMGNSPFCITTSASNSSLNCKYASMAACEVDAKPQNYQCSANPKKMGTTGSR